MQKLKSGPAGKPKIHDFQDYRSFVRAWIKSHPNGGRGILARLSENSGIHKTTLSQIMKGQKDFSLEQAHQVATFLGLGGIDTEYLLLLVNGARAGSAALRAEFQRQIEAHRKQRQQLVNRVTRSKALSGEERAIFYSSWIYSAVRNLSATGAFGQPDKIAQKLGLSREIVDPVVEFLLETGLCVREGGRIRPGAAMTHLDADSPLVARHHGNWRIKAMERHPLLNVDSELAYTAPMTLSAADARKIRALLADVVQATDEIVGPSPSEKLYCMCLDWFEIGN